MDEVSAFKNLAEFDSLLRGQDSSTHYEALFYLPFLFKDFSSPSFVQAGVLKLTEAFCEQDNITKAFVVQAFQYSAPFLMQMPQPDDFLARLFPLAYRSSETDLGVMVFVLEILSALAPIVWHRPKALFFVMSPVRDMAAKGTSQSITTSWYFWKAWATCCGKFLDLARSCNVKGSFGAESEPLRSKIVVSELSKALNYLSKHSSALPIDLIKELT